MTDPARPFHWSFYAFFPVTLLMLFLDSTWLWARGINGQMLNNVLVPLYLYAMYRTMPDERLKKIMLLTIPVSAVGEVILSMGIDLYTYKFGYVPVYVPFGHAVVIGSGFQLLWHEGLRARAEALVPRFLFFYAALFLAVFLAFGDSFTVLLGLLFFAGVLSRRERLIYLFMPILVLFVELVGTAFGCWRWAPLQFELLATTNPPAGSVMFYVYLDIIVMALGTAWAADRFQKCAAEPALRRID